APGSERQPAHLQVAAAQGGHRHGRRDHAASVTVIRAVSYSQPETECQCSPLRWCTVTETSAVSFDEVAWLRDNSPAWRLLRADHAPLILSFLHQVFVTENVRSIPRAGLGGPPA